MDTNKEIAEIREGLRALGQRAASDQDFARHAREAPDEVLGEFGLSLERLAPYMKPDRRLTPRRQCEITCFNPWPTIRCTNISVLV